MSIRLVEDVGAPAAVVAVDMLTLEMAPNYNEIASYLMTGVGYAAGFFLRGKIGDFLTTMGVASLPLTCRAIRERVKQPVAQRASASRMAFRHTSAAPSGNPGGVGRLYQPEFEEAGAHAI